MLKTIFCQRNYIVAIALTGSMLFSGCVTNKEYNAVVSERDVLALENAELLSETYAVETVAIALSAELDLAELVKYRQ